MYDSRQAVLEANLARAHRAVNTAKAAADELGDDGMWLDLQMLETEITRLAEAALKDKRRKSARPLGKVPR